MLKKFAVALIAASVFAAPVFAQGTATNPPTKSDKAAPAKSNKAGTTGPSTTSNVNTQPGDKSAEVKKTPRHAHYVKHKGKHHNYAKHHKKSSTEQGARTVKHLKSAKAHHVKHQHVARNSATQSATHAHSNATTAPKSVN
jgi:hypothetical protein